MYDYITYGNWDEMYYDWDKELQSELDGINFENHLKTGYYKSIQNEETAKVNPDIFYESEYLESFDTSRDIQIWGFTHKI